jgi:hypothetical protein
LAEVHTRLRESRETERSVLVSLRMFPDIELISFADLLSGGETVI